MIYSFPESSPIKEITFHFAEDRPPVALLAAKDGLPPDQLSAIRESLNAQGWQSVPVFENGRNVLEVTGFKQTQNLNSFLKEHHLTAAASQVTQEAGDNPKRSTKEWLQHNTLRAAGLLNLVGDATLLGSGIKSKNGYEIVAGGLYTAGAGILARYGNVRTERQVHQVMTDTAEMLKQEAVRLPQESELSCILQRRREGKLTEIEDFLHRYPAQVMLGAYTLGAAAMLASGFKTKNNWTKAYGVSSLGFKAASFAIPEKSQKEEKREEKHGGKPRGAIGAMTEWVQEKPLRLFGYGSFVTDSLLGISAYSESKRNPGQGGYAFKHITTGAYLAADVLMSQSNKDLANAEGRFDADEQRRVLAVAADAIMRQPEDMREHLTEKLATVLAVRPEMQGGVEHIDKAIREQMAHMEQNPWANRARADATSGAGLARD